MSATIIILLAAAAVLALAVMTYNGLVQKRVACENGWAQIDVQLKRRHDLIPNLVETVKGYASHEKETLDQVIQARNSAMQAQSSGNAAELEKAENMLSSTLKSIFALSEAYPDLKANTNFLELQRELSDTENKIQASRRFYNTNVRDFNTKLEVFPTNMIAGMLGFKNRQFFEAGADEKENIKVSF